MEQMTVTAKIQISVNADSKVLLDETGTADKILDFSKEEKGFAKLFIRGKEEGS
ncbi:MAG: hypothetical protein K5744_03375 [Eubacterium sp.]|nr:hypothetical protein [Eubacterium sp.]